MEKMTKSREEGVKESSETLKPPELEKWNNLSVLKCMFTHDILAQLERGGALPEGKTAGDESIKKAGDLMDYAERVLGDDSYWASLPEEIHIRGGYTVGREELKTELIKFIQESR